MFNSSNLSIALSKEDVFVHPCLSNENPILKGTVHLKLSQKRALKSLEVHLIGLSVIEGEGGIDYESERSLQKDLEIDLHGEVFQEGSYAFDFEFIIPSSAAVYQRSKYGRVRHYVKANLHFTSALSRHLSTNSIAFFIIANPHSRDEAPLPFEARIECFREDTGPVGISISSPYLAISALLYQKITFAAPPSNLKIISISSFIAQSFTLYYCNGRIVHLPPERHKMYAVDSQTPTSPDLLNPKNFEMQTKKNKITPPPLVELDSNEEWSFERICRVGSDDYIRATTLEGTETKIRVSHKLIIEIRYRDGSSEKKTDKILTLSKEVMIASCCTHLDSVQLPFYSKTDLHSVRKPLESESKCRCNYSLEKMLDEDGKMLERAGSSGGSFSMSRSHSKEE